MVAPPLGVKLGAVDVGSVGSDVVVGDGSCVVGRGVDVVVLVGGVVRLVLLVVEEVDDELGLLELDDVDEEEEVEVGSGSWVVDRVVVGSGTGVCVVVIGAGAVVLSVCGR